MRGPRSTATRCHLGDARAGDFYRPTFGLIGVDRETSVRTPRPSLAWLGVLARANVLPTAQAPDPVPVG